MMLMSLFSVFDPVSSVYFSMNWTIFFFVFFLFPLSYYLLFSNLKTMIGEILFFIEKNMKDISFPSSYGVVYFSMTLFFFISMMNLMGLFPFVFTATSHLVITMSMGVIMWVSFFLMGYIMMFKKMTSHLVPESSPMVLSFFMVLIESLSHLIRPFTLSIRLAANMMAGHLIIGLLAMISMVSFSSMIISILIQMLLLVLEISVCVIQGLVFSILLLLYLLECY